jgi:hypothetical protein
MSASPLQRAFKSRCWPSLGFAKERGSGAKVLLQPYEIPPPAVFLPRLLRVDRSDTVDLDCSVFQ